MTRFSSRASGALLAGSGAVLAAVHLYSIVQLRAKPALVVVEGVAPLTLALCITAAGALLYGGRLVPAQFADRVVVWAVVGAVALVAAMAALFVDAALRGSSFPATSHALLNATTLGTLAGLLVGVYDARGRHQRSRTAQLTRINDTLRIATQEVVNAKERSELEQAICNRLTGSEIYDRAWLGRYDPEIQRVRPVAWAGHDEAYVDSLEVTVDPDDPMGNGPGGRAIRTGEIQAVPDVHAEPTLEPWWDLLRSRGIESLAVVPIVGEEVTYGFLSVYASRTTVFDPTERKALSELGESIGHAIDAMEAREQLARRERELTRQNERLDEFASVVSHDLRNPLTVAGGNLELARETGEYDHLDRVADALDRMEQLIEDVLTLARNGQRVSEFHPVDLRAVVEGAWTTADTRDAILRIDGDLGTVRGDESRVVQLFENLFRNCVDHGSTGSRRQSSEPGADAVPDGPRVDPDAETPVGEFVRGGTDGPPSGGVTVTVGLLDGDGDGDGGPGGDRDEPAGDAGFYVEDDGPGIPGEERDRVFKTGYSTATAGTGLGLNIVRSIAEAHDWQVTVTESASGGARFEFTGIERAETPAGDGAE